MEISSILSQTDDEENLRIAARLKHLKEAVKGLKFGLPCYRDEAGLGVPDRPSEMVSTYYLAKDSKPEFWSYGYYFSDPPMGEPFWYDQTFGFGAKPDGWRDVFATELTFVNSDPFAKAKPTPIEIGEFDKKY